MNKYSEKPRRAEQGFALVVAMVMLVIIALLAISSMRGTTLQTRMAGNMYDRGLAFQTSETALIAAQNAITAAQGQSLANVLAALNALDCTNSDVVCSSDPFAATSSNWNWAAVGETDQVNADLQEQTAEFHVDYLGERADVVAGSGSLIGNSANTTQYGSELTALSNVTRVYRVTVRNAPDATGGRAEVLLQSTIEVKD